MALQDARRLREGVGAHPTHGPGGCGRLSGWVLGTDAGVPERVEGSAGRPGVGGAGQDSVNHTALLEYEGAEGTKGA